MIKIEDVEVMGMRKAIKGMRHAMNSWDKSDSGYALDEKPDGVQFSYFKIGEADMKLCKNLIKAGSSDRKFLRMIHVQANVTAPLYWWKEYDTYKVGTVANSTSTMHKIHSKPFELKDFSTDHMNTETLEFMNKNLGFLEDLRIKFVETKDKDYWYSIIQLLPESYNQMRTCTFLYENAVAMYNSRKNHKLDEWHTFCDWVLELPYFKELFAHLISE